MSNKYWYCPLYCFKCESEVVTLEANIQIVKMPREFYEFLFEESDSSFFRAIPSEADWIISIPQREATETGQSRESYLGSHMEEIERAKELTVDLITALRLLKEGRVIPGVVVSASYPEEATPSFGGTIAWTSVTSLDFFEEESTYSLVRSDLDNISVLFGQILGWRDNGILNQLRIPLHRFHTGYLGDIEERLVDQIIALESLYLGDSQELSYKLALRASYQLGNTRETRNEIFRDLKRAYTYRNRIVHGNTPPSREQLRQVVPKTEEYLRQSLRTYLFLLSQGNTMRQIQQELLDNVILEGGQ